MVPETWLLLFVSPSVRSEIGTPATRVLAGSSRASTRYSRSAVLHSHSTMSFTDAPRSLPAALTSLSGSDTPANARWFVIDALNGVGGAIFSRVPGAPDLATPARRAASAALAAWNAAPANGGSSLANSITWRTWLLSAAPSSSAMPSW